MSSELQSERKEVKVPISKCCNKAAVNRRNILSSKRGLDGKMRHQYGKPYFICTQCNNSCSVEWVTKIITVSKYKKREE